MSSEILGRRLLAAIPERSPEGEPIYKAILDVLIIQMVADLFVRIFTNGGCIAPGPIPPSARQVHGYLTREFGPFERLMGMERRHRRRIESAANEYLAERNYGRSVRMATAETLYDEARKLTLADVESVQAELRSSGRLRT